ncbi:hypothetical protein IW262DRAFT_1246588, partial [Armillaria fumosa]
EVLDKTNSKYAVKTLTSSHRKLEDDEYINVKNSDLIKATVAALRERETDTTFQWVKKHDDHQTTAEAARLAREGALKPSEEAFTPKINPKLRITGALLSNMTQKLAYKAIRIGKMRKCSPRRRTKANLEFAKADPRK